MSRVARGERKSIHNYKFRFENDADIFKIGSQRITEYLNQQLLKSAT